MERVRGLSEASMYSTSHLMFSGAVEIEIGLRRVGGDREILRGEDALPLIVGGAGGTLALNVPLGTRRTD